MSDVADDDDVYVDDLVDELRDEMRKRGYTETLEFLDEVADHDNGYDISLAVSAAYGHGIPIPEHFIEDFKILDRIGDIQPGDVDHLNDVLALQRERGLISY